MKQISYFELLNMIKKGEAPQYIRVIGKTFRFSIFGYIEEVYEDEPCSFLSDVIRFPCGEIGMVWEKYIEVLE